MSSPVLTVNTTNSVSTSFSASVEPFLQQGWPTQAFLPGIPLGAELTSGSQVKPGTIGKVPGQYYRSKKWSGMPGAWGKQGLAAISKTLGDVAAWPTPQVCVLGRDAPALDIDIEDQALADRVHTVAEECIGEALVQVRIRQGTGRRLLPFLPLVGPVARWQIRFELPGVATHQIVEMIGSGFQWLGAGEHKSGNGYEWPFGVPAYAELPVLTEDASQALRARMADLIVEMGGRLIGSSASGVLTTGRRALTDDLEPLLSMESLAELLDAVPDTPETVGGWDEGVSLLASIRYVLGREGRHCPGEVLAWAAGFPGSDDGWAADRWRSFDSGVEVTEGRFLMWVEEHAPVDLAQRIRREIEQRMARRVFQVVPDAVEAGGEGEEDADPVEMQEADDMEPEERLQAVIDEALGQLAYFEPDNCWVFLRERLVYSVKAFDSSGIGLRVSEADHVVAVARWNGRGIRPRTRSAHTVLVAEAHRRKLVVKARTYAFGDGPLVRLGMTGVEMPYLNTALPALMQPWPHAVTDADVEPYLAHARRLLPADDEREAILSWVAWVLQNPTEKIRWSPVLKGPQGHGKDTLFKVLAEGVGPHNFEEVRPEKLAAQFTSFYEKRVVLVTEMANSERTGVYERIKAAITGSAAGFLWVERKRIDPYPTLDRVAWVMLTNHDDAIAMAADDRRFYVGETSTGSAPPKAYFDTLYNWLETEGGNRKVVRWMLQRSTENISPNRPPDATEAKREMTMAAMPLFSRWLVEQLQDPNTIWGRRTVVGVGEVQSWVENNTDVLPRKVAERYHPRMVREALRAAGWVEYGGRIPLEARRGAQRMRVWAASEELAQAPAEVIRARLSMEMSRMGAGSPFDVVAEAGGTGIRGEN